MTRRNISSGGKWPAVVGYSRAVRKGSQIAVAGTTAAGSDGSIEHPDDAYEQAKRIFQIIEKALGDAGASMADILHVAHVRHRHPPCRHHGRNTGASHTGDARRNRSRRGRGRLTRASTLAVHQTRKAPTTTGATEARRTMMTIKPRFAPGGLLPWRWLESGR